MCAARCFLSVCLSVCLFVRTNAILRSKTFVLRKISHDQDTNLHDTTSTPEHTTNHCASISHLLQMSINV